MKKVTGIGGVFFKSKDVPKLKEWYRDNLGFETTDWGASMVWTDPETKSSVRTEWSPFKESSDYYAPSTSPFMVNYRVNDLLALVGILRNEGVTIVGDVNDSEYGKFAWIMDPEGRKIELYQPADTEDFPTAWTDKVVGLAGIFFKSGDPEKMKEWYKKHLDIGSQLAPMSSWTPLRNDDKLFAGTDKPYVFAYRVRNLKELLDQLKASGIATTPSSAIDPDGNKVMFVQQ